MSSTFLIKKPLVTERSTALSSLGKYVFKVAEEATKNEIKKAIHELYKVEVVAVNIIRRPAKRKTFRNRRGHQPGYKKAIVTLKAGQTIDVQ